MNGEKCDRFESLKISLRKGSIDFELQEHIVHCETCQEAEKVLRYMYNLSTEPVPPLPPQTHLIWIKRYFAKQEATARKILHPLIFIRTGLEACLAMGILFFFLGNVAPSWSSYFTGDFLQGLVPRDFLNSPFLFLGLFAFMGMFLTVLFKSLGQDR